MADKPLFIKPEDAPEHRNADGLRFLTSYCAPAPSRRCQTAAAALSGQLSSVGRCATEFLDLSAAVAKNRRDRSSLSFAYLAPFCCQKAGPALPCRSLFGPAVPIQLAARALASGSSSKSTH